MRPLVLAIVCACGSPSSPRSPVPPPPADAAAPAIEPVLTSADTTTYPDDPPEPPSPEIECAFETKVTCQPGVPPRTALQAAPFEGCARSLPAPGAFSEQKLFSARLTRATRASHSEACCYIERHATACD